MIPNRAISYIILLIFYITIFIFVKFFNHWFLPIENITIKILLFSFFVSLSNFIALDFIKKKEFKRKAFLTLAFRSSKLLLYLFFSIYIYIFIPHNYIKEVILIYVSLYFLSSIFEILHSIMFLSIKNTD